MKFPNFTFEGGRRQTTTIFSFSFLIWNREVRIRLQQNFFFSGLEDIFVWLFCVTTGEH